MAAEEGGAGSGRSSKTLQCAIESGVTKIVMKCR